MEKIIEHLYINSKDYSIGKLSMKKNPKHPLYLLFDTKLESFNIGEYIKNETNEE